ncbi:Uncharacterized protein BCZB5J_00163 [Bacillus cereus]|nr:Uncharacterized protein BCZB5J_00163 [Bacillus cereus]
MIEMSLEDLKKGLQTQPNFMAALRASKLTLPDQIETLLCDSFGLENAEDLKLPPEGFKGPTDNRLLATGKTTVLNVRNAHFSVEFVAEQDKFDFVLRIDLPSNWSFKKSFPKLPLDSPLNDLVLERSSFLFSTKAIQSYQWSIEHVIPLERGQSIAALLKLEGVFKPVSKFLPQSTEFLFNTLLDVPTMLDGNLPKLEWLSSPSAKVNMPDFLQIDSSNIGLRFVKVEEDVPAQIVAFFEVHLKVGSTTIPIGAVMQEGDLTFTSVEDSGRALTLEPRQVFALMNGLNWFKQIPAKLLSFFTEMKLKKFMIKIQPANLKVVNLQVQVLSVRTWDINIGNTFHIKPMIEWFIEPSRPPKDDDLILKGILETDTSKPLLELNINRDLTMEGVWSAENPEDLKVILDRFGIPIPEVPKFPVTKLVFRIEELLTENLSLTFFGKQIELAKKFKLIDPSFQLRIFSVGGKPEQKITLAGTVDVNGVKIPVIASHSDSAWSKLCGELVTSTDIKGTVKSLMGANVWPDWLSDVLDVPLHVRVCFTMAEPITKCTITFEFPWNLDLGYLKVYGSAKLTISHITEWKSEICAKVKIQGIGAEVELCYEFTDPPTDVFTIKWEGIEFDYDRKNEALEFSLSGWNLGKLLTAIMKMTGNPYFQLPGPLNQLLQHNIENVKVIFKFNKEDFEQSKVSVDIDNINIVGVKKVSILKDKVKDGDRYQDRVMLTLNTTWPEPPDPWDLTDPSNQPDMQIPGFTQTFELRWLALGQRVSLISSDKLKNIEEAVCAMKSAFIKPPQPDNQSLLKYDPNSSWIIGTDFGFIKLKDTYFLDMQIIFNDPGLYGLRLALNGELADIFNGLKFEVMYKKKGSVGVYAGEITLPDRMRYFRLGAMDVTLPVFAFKLFTNGDFEVDVGFPHNLDFSRSLMIQVPPYYAGAGGFYFAKLSNGDQSERLPKLENGEFRQVLEFGLGMALGIGRDINVGNLKAGFNVSAVGIFEGVLATFHGTEGEKDRYYKIAAMVGIIGRLYGSVTFPLIRADVNVAINIVAETIIEAYQDLLIRLIADVDVSASIKINLGIKKIKISYSFQTHLEESFSLGGKGNAPWIIEDSTSPMLFEDCNLLRLSSESPEWKPLPFYREITLYFVPHLFVEQRIDTNQYEAGYVAMLYTAREEFEKLASMTFLWVLQAFGQSDFNEDIHLERVQMALQWLQEQADEHGCPIDYEEIKEFLKSNFCVNIQPLPNNALELTEDVGANVFPMIPELTLHYPNPDQPGEIQVNFAEKSMCSPMDLKNLHDHFEQMRVRYLSEIEGEQPEKTFTWTVEKKSLTTVLFEDCFVIIAKNLLQSALSELKANDCKSMPWKDLNEYFKKSHYATTAGMVTYLMMNGMRLPETEHEFDDENKECREKETETLYRLTGQQFLFPNYPGFDPTIYSIKLSKSQQDTDWICLKEGTSETCTENELRVTLNPDDTTWRDAVLNTASTGIQTVDHKTDVQPMPSMQHVTKVYSLTNFIQIVPDQFTSGSHVIDDLSNVWILPNSILQQLARPMKYTWTVNQKKKENKCDRLEAINDYKAGTLLNVSLKKLAEQDIQTGMERPTNTYELIGTDEIGTTLLERLLKENGIPDQVYILYPQNPEKKDSSLAYQGGTNQIIVKANLSTETNPSDFILGWNGALEYQNINEFIQWLWEGSIVRSGGFYYHQTEGEFPEEVFDEEGIGSIRLLFMYNNTELVSYVNCVINANPGSDNEFLYLTAGYSKSYRVKANDTLAGIALQCGISPFELVRILADTTLHTVTLSIPGKDPYPVKEKETLSSIAFNHRVSIEQLSWNNLDVQQIFPVDVDLQMNGEVKEKVPTMPPGNVGFTIMRRDVGEDQDDVQTYLEHQYAHLGYWVTENQDFNKSCEGLPIAAQKSETKPTDSVAKCQYQKVVPVHPFAKFNPLPDKKNLPPRNFNPYAGVGSIVELDFIWRDLFGDGLDLRDDLEIPLKIPVGYTDRIIGFEQWPSLILNYYFKKKHEKRELVLDMKFDRSRYEGDFEFDKELMSNKSGCNKSINNKSTSKDRAMVDKLTYAKIYYQLCQQNRVGDSNISFTVETSVDQEAKQLNDKQISELQQFIQNSYKYLLDLVEEKEQENFIQPHLQLVFQVEDCNDLDIYELDVRFIIRRPIEHVNIEFRDDNNVLSSLTYVSPRMEAPQTLAENENSRALKWFANQFEEVFNFEDYYLKVAVGESRSGGTGSDAKKIWIVRLAKPNTPLTETRGIVYFVESEPVFYAPLPLSTKLISREVKVRKFNKDGTLGDPESEESQPFTRIDMDKWAQKCLEAIEEVLSPSIAIQAYTLAPDAYKNILSIKESLASSISNSIELILDPKEGSLPPPPEVLEQLKAEAAEKLRQQLLIKLTNAYDIETVVVYMASVRSQIGTQARLYGQILTEPYQKEDKRIEKEPAKATESYSTSKGKICLQTNEAPLAFTFNARTAEYQSHLNLKLSYQVLYIEHEIDTLPGIPGYEASSWLGFVNPLPPLLLRDGHADIPIPLRNYPEEPSLNMHKAIPFVRGSENEETTIQDSVKYNYQYEYGRTHAAQDTVISRVKFNLAKGEKEFRDDLDLFDKLAQFIHVYEGNDGMKEALKTSIKNNDPELIKNILSTFSNCIQEVSEKWNDWFIHRKPVYLEYDSDLVYAFEIKQEEYLYNKENVLKIGIIPTEKPTGVTIPDPKVLIDGYEPVAIDGGYIYKEKGRGIYLKWGEALSIRERKVSFEHLNVLMLQNAWSTIRVYRNRDLVPKRKTNDSFIYTTPEVGFAEKLTPLLDIHPKIRIGQIEPIRSDSVLKLQLEEHMYNLFETLFADLDQVLEKIPYLKQQTVKVETRYQYSLEGQQELPSISLPISLILPRIFEINVSEGEHSRISIDQIYIDNIVKSIYQWQNVNHPSSKGQYRYDLSIFSNLNNTKLPLLRLHNLILNHDEINFPE